MNVSIADIKPSTQYQGKRTMVVSDDNQDTNEIIRYIKKQHADDQDKGNYARIAKPFWQGNAADTAKLLFDFHKKYVDYKVEPPEEQTVKTPGAILHQGHGDCKHYALFTCGVVNELQRMGLPIRCKYRFVSDSPGREIHHVFAVVSDGRNEYWVDPVLKRFNHQPRFYNVKDFTMSQVGAIYQVSGTNWDVNLPMVGYDAEIGAKKHKNVFKNLKAEVKKGAQKFKAINLKIGLSPARNSFLALVDLNAFQLAHRLHDTIYGPDQAKKNGLFKKWESMGGSKDKLIKAVHNGYRHYQKTHKVKNMVYGTIGTLENADHARRFVQDHIRMRNECTHHNHAPRMMGDYAVSGTVLAQVGVAPAAIPAMLALASAIIAAVKPYLKKSPADDNQMANAGKGGAEELIKNASDGIDIANGDKGGAAATAMQRLTDGGVVPTNGGGTSPVMQASTAMGPEGPELRVNKVSHPFIDNAGEDGNGSPDSPAGVQKTRGGNFLAPVTEFFSEHKKMILIVLGILLAGGVVYKVATVKRRRR